MFTERDLINLIHRAHIVFDTQGFRGADMTREPLFRFGDFAIWSLILGSVIGYQLWTHDNPVPLTTVISVVEGVTG